MDRVRAEIVFVGRVQGVGFRATTQRIADGFAVSGWVRNEPDGSVRCVAEGEADEVERFVAAVQEAMQDCIRSTRVARSPATGSVEGFVVRR